MEIQIQELQSELAQSEASRSNVRTPSRTPTSPERHLSDEESELEQEKWGSMKEMETQDLKQII